MAETSPHWREPGPRKAPTLGDWTSARAYHAEGDETGKTPDAVNRSPLSRLENLRIEADARAAVRDPWD